MAETSSSLKPRRIGGEKEKAIILLNAFLLPTFLCSAFQVQRNLIPPMGKGHFHLSSRREGIETRVSTKASEREREIERKKLAGFGRKEPFPRRNAAL